MHKWKATQFEDQRNSLKLNIQLLFNKNIWETWPKCVLICKTIRVVQDENVQPKRRVNLLFVFWIKFFPLCFDLLIKHAFIYLFHLFNYYFTLFIRNLIFSSCACERTQQICWRIGEWFNLKQHNLIHAYLKVTISQRRTMYCIILYTLISERMADRCVLFSIRRSTDNKENGQIWNTQRVLYVSIFKKKDTFSIQEFIHILCLRQMKTTP